MRQNSLGRTRCVLDVSTYSDFFVDRNTLRPAFATHTKRKFLKIYYSGTVSKNTHVDENPSSLETVSGQVHGRSKTEVIWSMPINNQTNGQNPFDHVCRRQRVENNILLSLQDLKRLVE